ncbi:uncharacterized protein LOC122655978 isoform X1 [Telopea speciosissima]|uniref:uncharacterized protein LOC122655978 isoform X1 n=1 Tax=Telopea speciosissima TaxID=54955 RepID=UPI001CC3EED8|nr:uncharacterized protein LOC122655978 isoform X1 [Telopea speciosissima]
MLGICCPRDDSLQPKVESKHLPNYSFSGYFDHGRIFPDLEDKTEDVVDRAWKYVLKETGGKESNTRRLYEDAVARVETQARAVYVEGDSRSKDEFLRIMTQQGCFILQVALCSLGGPKPLGYPPDDPCFGERGWDKEQIKYWVTSIFYIKSQIPLVILKELMKESFFQKVLKSGKWKRPKDLARMALYDFVVEPMLDEPVNQRSSIRRLLGFFFNRRSRRFHQEPITPLHALWLLLTGPVGSRGKANHIEEDEDDHLYTTLSSVRSIMELQAAGIAFKSAEGLGTRQIKFKKRMLDAHLYLPCIYIEHDTMALFQNLIDYETAVDLDTNGREISAYISFMKELIRSRDDVKVLVTQGIIDTNPDFENELPGKLWSLDTFEVGNSHNLVAIRRQIRRYVRPSIRAKMVNLVVIGVFLTLVQTIYTALSYHHPLH